MILWITCDKLCNDPCVYYLFYHPRLWDSGSFVVWQHQWLFKFFLSCSINDNILTKEVQHKKIGNQNHIYFAINSRHVSHKCYCKRKPEVNWNVPILPAFNTFIYLIKSYLNILIHIFLVSLFESLNKIWTFICLRCGCKNKIK